QPLRPDGLGVDARARARRALRARARGRHRVPEPLRLPRAVAAVDGLEGERPGLDALAPRLPAPHPLQERAPESLRRGRAVAARDRLGQDAFPGREPLAPSSLIVVSATADTTTTA